MTEHLTLTAEYPVPAQDLYRAWMDSAAHSAFTGAAATIDPSPGGTFSAWDGYILGTTLEVEPPRRIVQAWRTTEFPEGSPDSRLEIVFEDVEGGARITLQHSQIPDGQAPGYEQGWQDFYFAPLREYLRARGA